MARPSDPTGSRRFFVGVQSVATVESLNAFVRSAKALDEFVYCAALDPIRGETWSRVGELVQQGLVRSHQRKRQGGGSEWFVVRTAKKPRREPTPQEAVLDDGKTKAMFDILCRAANMGDECPSDAELGRKVGIERSQASWRFKRLVLVELVESQVVYEDGVPRRVVTIVKTGKRTALPPKWRALEAAAARDAGGMAGPDAAAAPARSTFPRSRRGAL